MHKKFFTKVIILLISIIFNTNFYFYNLYGADHIIPVPEGERAEKRLSEDNGIAEVLCIAVNVMRSDIAKVIVALFLFSLGVGTFFGKLTLSAFFFFVVGASIYFSSDTVLSFFVPFSEVEAGCSCKQYILVSRTENGDKIYMDIKLDKHCREIS